MSETMRIGLIIVAGFIVLGIVAFVVIMSIYRWDFSKLGTTKMVLNTYEISEDFTDIALHTDTAKILFAVSDDGSCRVVCKEMEKSRHSVAVDNGTLTVNVVDERAWYEHWGISFESPQITVYLPQREYGSLSVTESTGNVEIPQQLRFSDVDLSLSTGAVKYAASASGSVKIRTSTGKINVNDISVGALELSVSTGEISASNITCDGEVTLHTTTGKAVLKDVSCGGLVSDGSTGDLSLNDVIAEEKVSIERSTGNVKLEGCDAAQWDIQTKTGDVSGTLLSEMIFFAETNTGSVNIPKTTTGGKCQIKTSTGDIQIRIK